MNKDVMFRLNFCDSLDMIGDSIVFGLDFKLSHKADLMRGLLLYKH